MTPTQFKDAKKQLQLTTLRSMPAANRQLQPSQNSHTEDGRNDFRIPTNWKNRHPDRLAQHQSEAKKNPSRSYLNWTGFSLVAGGSKPAPILYPDRLCRCNLF